MKPVVYVGPGDGVHLAPVHGDLWCPHGEPVDVDAEVAKALLEQDTFESPRKPKSDKEGTFQDGSTST